MKGYLFNALLPSLLETAADTAQVEQVRHKVCNIADCRTHTFVIVVMSDWFDFFEKHGAVFRWAGD